MNSTSDIDSIIARALEDVSRIYEVPVSPVSAYVDTPTPEEVGDKIVPQDIKNDFVVSSLVLNETTSRFSSATWYEKIQKQNVIVAGVGGIGSWCSLLLGRLNINSLILYDGDTIELSNMSGQLYGKSDVGKFKVNALYTLIRNYTEQGIITALPDNYTETSEAGPIMICGFDNMAARKLFFTKWLNFIKERTDEEKKNCLFIDARLAAEYFQVYCLQGDDTYFIDKYSKECLFSDAEADPTVCSYKQTSFAANMVASIMVNLFVNFVANMCNPIIPRDVPFLTEYDCSTMYFKVVK